MFKLLLCAVTLSTAVVFSGEKEDWAKKVLEASGAGALGTQVVDQMFSMYKAQMPQVPAEYWDNLSKEVSSDGFVELLIPVFARNYSLDELKGLEAFYKSPLGQTLVTKQPQIQKESMQVGAQWGQKIAQKVMKDLQAQKK